MKKLHIVKDSDDANVFKDYVQKAIEIGRPKVVYGLYYIDSRGDDYIIVDGTRFTSRVLSVNTEKTHRVFPYVATCGMELQMWADSIEDMLEHYWAEAINQAALLSARQALLSDLKERFQLEEISQMNPGSLQDWPINEQKNLFKLLGNVKEAVGVELTERFLMIPTKTVSGIIFPTNTNFESCQLCPRDNCPGRRAPYDKDLYYKRYSK
jgi:hypothetical protein